MNMQAIEEKFEPKRFLKREMRALKIKGAYLPVPLNKRDSVQAMASSMKKKEGLIFEVRRVGDILAIWRTA